ncbi:MAG: CheR family methyltransferase [Oscillochloridaceae bacterium umkhey_bin13]
MPTDLRLSDELYVRFRDLLLSRAGLFYPERRRNDLAHGLSQTAEVCGLNDLEALYTAISANGTAWDHAVAQLTIGETYFFRNGAQFAALRERILPDLISRRGGVHNLRLWSAGCATGEEPYSLAMALADYLPASQWQISILATDINPQFLTRAREAVYGSWSFRETTDAQRERFFIPEGTRWRLRPELRRQVVFARLNLAEPGYPAVTNGTVALDLIFCRNVTIYFDEATTRQVIERFYGALAPGGWLVVGHAEPHADIYRAFETHNAPGTVLYRKPLSAPAFVTTSLGGAPVALPSPHLPPAPAIPVRSNPPAPTQPKPTPRALQETVVAAPPPPPDYLAEGRLAANRGDWARARTAVDRALVSEPLRAEVHYLNGQLLEQAGDLDGALGAYRRSVYLDPNWVMGTLGMASIWQRTGQSHEARRSLRSAAQNLHRRFPDEAVPGGDGVTAAELLAYVWAQLELIGG